MSTLRQIKPISFSDLVPQSLAESEVLPEFEWVAPASLYVEDKYQRRPTSRTLKLIRRIIRDFSWSKYKPPVCSYGDGKKLFVIDGQHTAIAAAAIPGLKKIPVMIVVSPSVRERAAAFMGHNRDRTAITPPQFYYSSLAAEDKTALTLAEALRATGATIMRSNNNPVWVEGQTLAAGVLLVITEKYGKEGVQRVLDILMEAKRAPFTAAEIRAVNMLLRDKDWRGRFEDADLSRTIKERSIEEWGRYAEVHVRKGLGMSLAKAIAIAWFKKVPKKRRLKADQPAKK